MKTVVVATLAVAVFIAGCGGSGSSPKDPNRTRATASPSSSAAEPTSTVPPAPSAGNAPGIPVLTGPVQRMPASAVQYIDEHVGDGPSPRPNDYVTVNYTGWLTDGTKFDSSFDSGQSATFALNGVIVGWSEGLSTMRLGGKRRLIIPPYLAYGAEGDPPAIPPNATLIFDIELLKIN